jgi:hypothetical protein
MAGGSDATTSTSNMQTWAEPYAKAYLDRAGQVADQQYQPYTGQRTAGLNDQQYGAMEAIQNRAIGGDATQNAGAGYLQNLLTSGPGQNPYLDQQIAAGQKDMTQAYNLTVAPQMDRMAAQSGSFGNSGVMQMQQEAGRQFGEQLGNYSNTMRGNAYNLGQQQQMQAAQLAPTYANASYTDANALMSIGDRLQQQNQAGLDTQYQNYLDARNYNQNQLGVLGGALTGNYGGTTTQTNGSTSGAGSAVGAGLAGYATTGNPYIGGAAALGSYLGW